jgi:hypothetical protein
LDDAYDAKLLYYKHGMLQGKWYRFGNSLLGRGLIMVLGRILPPWPFSIFLFCYFLFSVFQISISFITFDFDIQMISNQLLKFSKTQNIITNSKEQVFMIRQTFQKYVIGLANRAYLRNPK